TLVAAAAVRLMHEAGVPTEGLQYVPAEGRLFGGVAFAHRGLSGGALTGTTATANTINRLLAAREGAIVPLIAETGGLNAMIVDSTALPEQVVDDVMQSAFRSAGQRCSALRLLCVHEGIADGVIEMLKGALAELRVGDPAELATDVGPLIDEEAFVTIGRHIDRLRREARLLGEASSAPTFARLLAPVAFEIAHVADLKEEV